MSRETNFRERCGGCNNSGDPQRESLTKTLKQPAFNEEKDIFEDIIASLTIGHGQSKAGGKVEDAEDARSTLRPDVTAGDEDDEEDDYF
ncbi:MAG: hypothetical protein M1812_000405 [Candelaria pacifica]|nr:MAG: hypothetical protein M1812_000405 [Candelaria pacifica]